MNVSEYKAAVKFSNIERKSNSKTQKGIPLVVTYHPLFKSLSGIVNDNIYLLHMDQEVKRTFTTQSTVSYRSVRVSYRSARAVFMLGLNCI